jgi:hypothetical protein
MSTAKDVASSCNEMLDGFCGLAGDFFDSVSLAVIPIFAM